MNDVRTPLAFCGALSAAIASLFAFATGDAMAVSIFGPCAIACAFDFGASVTLNAP